MKIWELEKDKVYLCEGKKYLYDKDGCIHVKRKLKRNGCESWFIFNPYYYEARKMDFELIKKESECNHTDSNGEKTLEYDINEIGSSEMYCTQCYKKGYRVEFN